ncbi:hypothetical protein ACS72_00430 [Acinetobacter sp. VT 511]|nr:hypothetical protein ACS72_00430 [Acinetobacter sp. VT 511]
MYGRIGQSDAHVFHLYFLLFTLNWKNGRRSGGDGIDSEEAKCSHVSWVINHISFGIKHSHDNGEDRRNLKKRSDRLKAF